MDTHLYLVQSDTTVGFASKDALRLAATKGRSVDQPFLETISSLAELKAQMRLPKSHKKRIRNAQRTTFIYPNKEAVRIVFEGEYHDFLVQHGWMYSSSANKTGLVYDAVWAESCADVVLYGDNKLGETRPSKIYKLSKSKIEKIR
jgi:tRNA A37 threonylcarbamoyladenosine synthetase subunit TsaC/SUA5/YrdC